MYKLFLLLWSQASLNALCACVDYISCAYRKYICIAEIALWYDHLCCVCCGNRLIYTCRVGKHETLGKKPRSILLLDTSQCVSSLVCTNLKFHFLYLRFNRVASDLDEWVTPAADFEAAIRQHVTPVPGLVQPVPGLGAHPGRPGDEPGGVQLRTIQVTPGQGWTADVNLRKRNDQQKTINEK